MVDATPAHISDMQQSVEAIEIDKRTEVGDVLDGALADIARSHLGEQVGASFGALLLDQFAAGQNNVLSFLIDLNDLVFVGVTYVRGQIFRRNDVNLGSRQECLHAYIDKKATFDGAFNASGNGSAFVTDAENFFPVLFEFCLFLGQDDHAFAVFQSFDQDVDHIAFIDGFDIVKFISGDGSFTFITNVHQDFFMADFDDGSFNNVTCR